MGVMGVERGGWGGGRAHGGARNAENDIWRPNGFCQKIREQGQVIPRNANNGFSMEGAKRSMNGGTRGAGRS